MIGSQDWPDRAIIEKTLRDVGATLVGFVDWKGAGWITSTVAKSAGLDVIGFSPNFNRDGEQAVAWASKLMIDVLKPDLVILLPMKSSINWQEAVEECEEQGIPVLVEEQYL